MGGHDGGRAEATSFGDRPVVVISATENLDGMPEGFLDIDHAMYAELAALSSRGQHVKLPAPTATRYS